MRGFLNSRVCNPSPGALRAPTSPYGRGEERLRRTPRNDEAGEFHYITPMTDTVRIQRDPFDLAAETAKLTRGRTDVGAVVSFTGICRGDENGEPIAALPLEH